MESGDARCVSMKFDVGCINYTVGMNLELYIYFKYFLFKCCRQCVVIEEGFVKITVKDLWWMIGLSHIE